MQRKEIEVFVADPKVIQNLVDGSLVGCNKIRTIDHPYKVTIQMEAPDRNRVVNEGELKKLLNQALSTDEIIERLFGND